MEECAWQAATTLFSTGASRSKSWRRRQLNGILRMLSECERQIQDALLEDLRKPPCETWWSEILVVRDSARGALEQLDKWMKPDKAWTPVQALPCSACLVPQPLGTVLVIAPWNFPFMLCLSPVVGAISAGCTAVIKPSELAPATAKLLSELVPKYLDRQAFHVILGGVPECTTLLTFKWDKIVFTGSSQVGRVILAAAVKHLTPVLLELGGKNPLFVDSSVNLEVAARRIAFGKWVTNSGQACVSPDYILAEEKAVPELISMLKKVLLEFYGKDPEKSPDITRIINIGHFTRLNKLLEDSSGSCQVVHGGDCNQLDRYISPTILLDVPLDSPLMKDEIFGPLLPIIRVRDAEHAIEIIRQKPAPLVVYAFTDKKDVKGKFISETTSGGLVFNDTVIQAGIMGLPFGGVGESGMGCYHGKFSFETFSHHKPVLHRHCYGDVSVRYPPYTDFKEGFARSLMDYDFLGVILTLLGLKKRKFYRGLHL